MKDGDEEGYKFFKENHPLQRPSVLRTKLRGRKDVDQWVPETDVSDRVGRVSELHSRNRTILFSQTIFHSNSGFFLKYFSNIETIFSLQFQLFDSDKLFPALVFSTVDQNNRKKIYRRESLNLRISMSFEIIGNKEIFLHSLT